MKPTIPAGLLLLLCAPVFAQQPAPPPPPAPSPAQPQAQQQTAGQTPSPFDQTPSDPVEFGASVKVFYWLSASHPNLLLGTPPTDVFGNPQPIPTGSENLAYPAANKRTPGVEITFPAGKFNRLEISFFQTDGSGTSVAPINLSLFGTNIPASELLSTTYRVRNLKVTWNYLTWPDPPEDSKFRIKTLWEFQYIGINSVVDAPLETSIAFAPAVGKNSIFYPTFGVGAEYVPSRHFYFEARASGFAFPGRSVIGDTEGNAVIRFGHVAIFGGEKLYHFKTSPHKEQYIDGTLSGPFFGVRWIFK
ncbi:MAG TPA: hypothetical protein VFW83_11425 [Bryobacteraceae bacterium]|nr:hypothetical protein [Bryobacteraceae bacterium]